MTISTTASRISYNGNGTTVAFSFPYRFLTNADLTVIRVAANGTETTLALGTDYTVTGADDDAGGTVTCVTAPVSGARLVIYRSVAITQEVDYITGDSFPAETHERALDRLTMVAQQLQDAVDRSAKLSETSTADADTLVTNINSLAAIEDDVSAVAAIDTEVSEVAAIDSNVTTVAGIAANVTTVAGVAANVTTVAGIAANVTTVAGIAANVTTVAGVSSAVTTVAGISSAVTTVAADGTDIGAVAAISADVQAVANIAADVSAVENIAANVTTVAGISSNVTTVAGISANVTTVAGISAAVSTVATDISDVSTCADNIAAIIAAPTEASNAAASAVSAANSAASAASALDSFDDRYLGSKTSDPTVDNDGNALVTGALYYNSSTQTMKVYDGANWIAATAAGTTAMLVYKYVATAGQTTFSGAASVGGTLSYTSGNIIVFLNGASLDSTDYTATNGTSVVLGTGAALSDEIVIVAFKSFTVADTYTQAQADAEFLRKANEDGVLIASGTPSNTLVTTTGGNVGIGTSSPAAPLDVLTNSSASGIAVRGRSDNISNIAFQSNNGATNYGQIQGRSTDLRIQGVSLPITFFGASSEWARINSSGQLLINRTGGLSGLVSGQIGSGALDIGISLQAATAGNWGLAFYNSGGSNVGTVTINSSSTSYNTASDYRLKEDVQPMTGALAKVAALKPVTYTWKNTGEADEGFIAHELQEVCPSAVTGEKDAFETYTDEDGVEQTRPKYQGIDTSFLVATLTAAIQEQQAIITALTARVTALEQTQE
jgi:hypothetical protein